MFKKLKTHKTLVKNFSSLSVLQISNYLFPLITFPYLVRVLGVENYGLANFAIAFSAYFVTITDYGFNLSATREVSIFRENKEQLQRIFSSTLIIKVFLFFISALIFFPALLIFEKFRSDYLIYSIAFVGVFGSVLFPIWFYQGIEKMLSITLITIIIRFFSVAGIFIFVKMEADVVIYLILVSGATVLMGLSSMIYLFSQYDIGFSIPQKISILFRLKRGWYLFLSTLSINLYTSSNTFLLGLLGGNVAVGYFSSANKIREAAQGILGNLGRTVYPHIGNVLQKSKSEGLIFIKKYGKLVGSLSFAVSVLIFLFAEQLVILIAGSNYQNSISVLRILAFMPFTIMLSNVFGIQLMLNLGYEKQFTKIIGWAALLNVILMFLFVPLLNEDGAALAMLLVEIFVTLVMILFCWKKGLLLKYV